jgi:hypothetical protein
MPLILYGLKLAWSMNNDHEVADGISKIINFINHVPYIESDSRDNFINELGDIITQIKTKYSDWKMPEKKGCFIATATLGDYNHPYVLILRRFRDLVLQSNNLGQSFIHHGLYMIV